MSVARYDSYRESGIEWLGKLPSQWSAKRLSWAFAEIGSGTTPPDDGGSYYNGEINWVTTGELREKEITSTAKQVSEAALTAFSSLRIYPPGTLLMAMYGATIGRLGWLGAPACTNQACCAFSKPIAAEPRFVFFSLQAALWALLDLSSGGGQPNINQEKLRAFRIPFPPVADQASIAAFLDRETGKIDALVEAQRRLIELLKEKRQAVISHAVTKGLDPTAPMKDSGVEWLGDVPAHWGVKKLGGLCSKIGSGKTPNGGSETYVDEGVAFLRSQNVYDEGLWLDELVFIDVSVDDAMASTRVLPGDVLLNITGASLGRTCIVPNGFRPANVNQHVCIIRLVNSGQRDFVSLALKSTPTKGQIEATQNGAAREGLNFQQIAALWIGMPPPDEAERIVGFINDQIGRLDRLAQQAEAGIKLLQERRSAMISAAVTGKIDVRGLVPEQAEAA